MSIRPKKKFGQNFLTDKNIQNKILTHCVFEADDSVLEIGPGRGDFTRLIAPFVKRLYAVEIDTQFEEVLKENLSGFDNIEVFFEDILKFDIQKKICGQDAFQKPLVVFGNIPYYITAPIIEYLVRYRSVIRRVYLTVQKEVAQRMVSKPGSKIYGAFSCFVQYYTRPEILFTIQGASFFPRPKVDSCFLRFEMLDKPRVSVYDEDKYFKLIRTAFGQRRKTLRNSVKEIVPESVLDLFFEKFRVDPKVRPEMLSLEDFAGLLEIEKNNEKKG